MLFNKKFDLVVSIGEDCACSSYLRRFTLQHFSFPFDWLTMAPFATRVDLICNNFEQFLNIEDLKFLPKKEEQTTDNNCDYYENTRNGFYFYHDFKKNVPFEEAFYKVKEKYTRRIERFYKLADCSENILFVWWSRDKHLLPDEIKCAEEKLKNKFKKDINLLIIEYGETGGFEYNQIGKNILKVSYDNISYKHNQKWSEVLGNEQNNNILFKQIKKKYTKKELFTRLKYKTCVFLVNLIPSKQQRHRLRDKVKKEYSHAAL